MGSYSSWDPDRDIPDLAGKIYVITGGTAGLGEETVKVLASHHAKALIFTGRNRAAADALIAHTKSSGDPALPECLFVETDFADLESVKRCATEIERIVSEDYGGRLDGLMCNAGIMAVPPQVSKDGYEIHAAVNHFAHALLFLRLASLLQANKGSRVVYLTSFAHRIVGRKPIDFDALKTSQAGQLLWSLPKRWLIYGQSKLMNILWVKATARRFPDIKIVAVHPGVIQTGLFTNLDFWNRWLSTITLLPLLVSLANGVKNQLWAFTTGIENLESGMYYRPIGESGTHSGAAQRSALAEELYDFTLAELKPFL